MKHLSSFGYNEYEIERAIGYLNDAMRESGHNPKPVTLHSIRTASLLWGYGLPQVSVLAAILHDTIEDSGITYEDIEKDFGKEVADIVDSLTVRDGLAVAESFKRSKALGPNALVVRAADLIENSHYYNPNGDKAMNKRLHDKYKLFMDMSKSDLIESPIYDLLVSTYKKNVESLVG